jgi:hypothetical protein
MITWILGYACLAIAAAGCVYLLCAAVACAKFGSGPRPAAARTPPIAILKPLKGAGLSLSCNLATFCAQNYPAPVQLIFGVQNPNDEAVAVVERLKTGLSLDPVNAHRRYHLHPTVLDEIPQIGRDCGMCAIRVPIEPISLLRRVERTLRLLVRRDGGGANGWSHLEAPVRPHRDLRPSGKFGRL